jgi:hypothetical protein
MGANSGAGSAYPYVHLNSPPVTMVIVYLFLRGTYLILWQEIHQEINNA